MSTNIIYTSIENNAVTEQQLDNLGRYFKHVFENEKLKKIEYYAYHRTQAKIVLRGGRRFLSAGENLADVINESMSEADDWTFYYNPVSNDQQNTLWDFQDIYKGELKSQGKEAFDSSLRTIAAYGLDAATNTKIGKRKYFYGDKAVFPGADDQLPTITFSYLDDDSPMEVFCHYGSETDNDYGIMEFLARDAIMAIFPWDQHLFYHSFEPMLP
jgi:hypothetical protein